jgi:3-deoxy-D-manno-octulosonate 8-phosphate phosphatase (KDO 8-P phosphatase)
MVPLDELDALVARLVRVWEAARRECRDGLRAGAARRHAAPRLAPELARRIRWVGFDVDGVLTDGGVYLGDVDGRRGDASATTSRTESASTCSASRASRSGIVTGRVSESVRLRAAELRADDVVQDPHARKLPALRRIAAERGISLARDGVRRRRPARRGRAARGRPAGGRWQRDRRRVARGRVLRLTRAGGAGAVREFAELLLRARGEWDARGRALRAQPRRRARAGGGAS